MFDAIVVGARCAGSPAAQMLASRGHKVLIVDKNKFPSDKPLSTHLVFHPGIEVISKLGLLDGVHESNCPPVNQFEFDFGPIKLRGSAPGLPGATSVYAPRRKVLDGLLVTGATEAGAGLREECVLEDLIVDDDRVVGIRACDKRTGTTFEERASIVIGADGIASQVAKKMKVPFVHDLPTYSGVYFGYWADAPLEDNRIRIFFRDNRVLAACPTNDGLTLFMDYFPVDAWADYVANVERSFESSWRETAPDCFEILTGGKRAERMLGTAFQPNFCRKAWGPGFALVGDALIHHDSINPSGISYALVCAEILTEFVHQSLSGARPMDDALQAYEEAVHRRWMPHFDFVVAGAKFAPPPDELFPVLGRAVDDVDVREQFMAFCQGYEQYSNFLDRDNLVKLAR